MANTKMTLVDWLDDLCVRFIVNLPNEELQSVERICFQIEEAQWFYEDFIRPLDPNNLPSMHLRKFSQLMFQHCPLFSAYSEQLHQQAYEQFLAYKTRVPVRGAIMLNDDMTHAVLVKGWKKGAKWSFPRGKINKEEADLDCAVREVYEETGYDLRQADLVLPEEHMKKITVTMREQSMMLYVFRGVPMNTYFEPRTRKEISKIDWYKLTDLPTLRRKNQIQQQGIGQDLIKESSFYMVAPFLGPLRSWIKQQHKLDRQKARSGSHLTAPPVAITDDEELQAEVYETMADEAVPVTNTYSSSNFADLVAQLGPGHRPSDTLPELSNQPEAQQQTLDPAAELKRLLSVGMSVQSPPVEAPGVSSPSLHQQANPLLALFKQGNHQSGVSQMPPPRTPFDQMMPTPIQPSSPHGQHHPRPTQAHDMPPPPFPFPSHPQGLPFRGPPQHFNGMPPHMVPQFMQPPQHESHHFLHQPPSMQEAFDERNPRPFHADPDSQFAGGQGRPVVPSASNLPAPKLNAHTLGLLNSFKIDDQKSPSGPSKVPNFEIQAHQSTPTSRMQHPLAQQRPHGLMSPPGPYTMSPPQYKSPPVSSSFQPEQPKPRTMHQDSLLTLFRGTPPLASPEPAELSALPTTPGYISARPVADLPRQPDANLLAAFGKLPTKTGATSATVSGPVNAPDFDTMKKHTQPISGSSRVPSPATQASFKPQQILKRSQASPVPQPSGDMPHSSRTRTRTPQNAVELGNTTQIALKPQILKRPQQVQKEALSPAPQPSTHAQGLLNMFQGPSPQPAPAQLTHSVVPTQLPASTAHAQGLLDMFKGPSPSPRPLSSQSIQPTQPTRVPANTISSSVMDRRDSIPSEQKNTLLSLFNKPSPKPQGAVPLRQTHSPIPLARSPYPPTPKTAMSGVISPVSPIPVNGSRIASPANVNSRSRISSIGDASGPSIVIPPTSDPGQMADGVHTHSAGGLSGQAKDRSDGKSPVDKTFLLGFLEDVARRGR